MHHKVRHSKEDALSQREFQMLLEGTQRLDYHFGLQARFIILVGGRLGLRKGEIAHMDKNWVNWRRGMIEIPIQDNCTKGKDGGICGYCKQLARQRVDYNPDMDMEEAKDLAWVAKTEEAARDVPFTFSPRVSIVLERFFDEYDEFPTSSTVLTRRVKRAARNANEIDEDDIYIHCLRATAASYHAARGLDVLPLQSLMGWAQVSTAHNYVQASGENTARALHYTHSQ